MSTVVFGKRQKCLCAFCGHTKKVYKQKRANAFHIFISLTISLLFMTSYWQSWDLRGGYVFFICLVSLEILIHFRWRLSLICRQCGFDPLLYLKNHNKAAEKVKNFLDRRKLDPRFLNAPAINIPQRNLNQKIRLDRNMPTLSPKSNKGQIVSRSI